MTISSGQRNSNRSRDTVTTDVAATCLLKRICPPRCGVTLVMHAKNVAFRNEAVARERHWLAQPLDSRSSPPKM